MWQTKENKEEGTIFAYTIVLSSIHSTKQPAHAAVQFHTNTLTQAPTLKRVHLHTFADNHQLRLLQGAKRTQNLRRFVCKRWRVQKIQLPPHSNHLAAGTQHIMICT